MNDRGGVMILPEEMNRIEFLQNLGAAHAARLALLAELRECSEGTVLFRDGQPSPFIYFVLSGKVALTIESAAQSKSVQTAGCGDLLGWSPVLGPQPMTATARTLERCRLAAFEACKIRNLCAEDPSFGMAFMKQVAVTLAKRLRASRQQHPGGTDENCRQTSSTRR
jgi:CRP-like cAMP-binding protein